MVITLKEDIKINDEVLKEGTRIEVLNEGIISRGEMPAGNKVTLSITNLGVETLIQIMDNTYPYDTLYIRTEDLKEVLES